jgi:hypothetical protein
MTGRQEYDRTKDRQRILDEYMIDYTVSFKRINLNNKSYARVYQIWCYQNTQNQVDRTDTQS